MTKYYFFGNYVLTASFFSWLAAQFIKVIINLIKSKKFIWERLWGSGGMPSAHSALVTAMTVSIGKIEGLSSPLFALAFINASIVMYDAMGVRRSAGEQAKVLNKFLRATNADQTLPQDSPPPTRKRLKVKDHNGKDVQQIHLKEVLGHTPIEVLCGIALGLAISLLMPVAG